MHDDAKRAPADRRAAWVGMRTLRQRPTIVGETRAGEAIYEIRSVGLVLAPGAAHFNRLEHCAKCGREMAGRSILAPTDLDRPPRPLFCASCSGTAGQAAAAPPSPPAPPPAPPPGPASAADAGRLAVLEAQLAAVMARHDASDAADTRPLAAALADAQADIRKLTVAQRECNQVVVRLAERLQHPPAVDIDETLDRRLEEARLATARIIDAERQQLHAVLAEGLDGLRAEIASREPPVDDQSAVLAGLLEAQRREVEAALHDVARQTVAGVAVPLKELTDSREEVNGRLEGLAEAVELMRAQVASLDERIDGLSSSAQSPEADRVSIEAAQEALAAVAQPLNDLTDSREEVNGRLEGLAEAVELMRAQVESLDERIDALSAPAPAQSPEADRVPIEAIHEALAAVAQPLKNLTDSREDVEGRIEALAEAVELVRAQLIPLDERIDGLSASVWSQRQEAERAPLEAAREALAAVAGPLRDLTLARQEIEHRLALLAEWADAGDSRQHVLEQKLNDCAERIAVIAERQAAPATQTVPAAPSPPAPPPPPPPPPRWDLLESLERQLREAERRIAQR